MAAENVKCAKLNQELPGIDADAPAGKQALKMALLLGGPELQERIRTGVSQKAWEMWTEHMLMVMNEFRLDPSSDESNNILGEQMEKFFFGEADEIPGYVPPKSS